MCRLALTVVDHRPALSRLDGERLGVALAGLGQLGHGFNIRYRTRRRAPSQPGTSEGPSGPA